MDKKPTADHIIKKHVLFAMGGSLVPIPVIDIVAVTTIQLDMIKQLGVLYDKDYKNTMPKSSIVALAGNTLARIGASALKGIPLFGTILGGVSMSALSGASTLAVGEVMVEHFEKGGDFTDFDPKHWRDYYERKYEEAKDIVGKWWEDREQGKAEETEAIEIPIEEEKKAPKSKPKRNTSAKKEKPKDDSAND